MTASNEDGVQQAWLELKQAKAEHAVLVSRARTYRRRLVLAYVMLSLSLTFLVFSVVVTLLDCVTSLNVGPVVAVLVGFGSLGTGVSWAHIDWRYDQQMTEEVLQGTSVKLRPNDLVVRSIALIDELTDRWATLAQHDIDRYTVR